MECSLATLWLLCLLLPGNGKAEGSVLTFQEDLRKKNKKKIEKILISPHKAEKDCLTNFINVLYLCLPAVPAVPVVAVVVVVVASAVPQV